MLCLSRTIRSRDIQTITSDCIRSISQSLSRQFYYERTICACSGRSSIVGISVGSSSPPSPRSVVDIKFHLRACHGHSGIGHHVAFDSNGFSNFHLPFRAFCSNIESGRFIIGHLEISLGKIVFSIIHLQRPFTQKTIGGDSKRSVHSSETVGTQGESIFGLIIGVIENHHHLLFGSDFKFLTQTGINHASKSHCIAGMINGKIRKYTTVIILFFLHIGYS